MEPTQERMVEVQIVEWKGAVVVKQEQCQRVALRRMQQSPSERRPIARWDMDVLSEGVIRVMNFAKSIRDKIVQSSYALSLY